MLTDSCDNFNDCALPDVASQPISQMLVKVAARCNIDCSYCYWFRDKSVYDKPKLMSSEVLHQLLRRLEEHIVRNSLQEFVLMLHGGEPLLWGVDNFHRLGEACRSISARTGCGIALPLTTNGVLLNDTWLDCFEAHDISVTISLDGPAHIHDTHRRTFQGGGTHAAVMRAVRLLQSRKIPVKVLAVCNPAHDPKEFFDFFADCEIGAYDILLPDATLGDEAPRVDRFYIGLFDLWLQANRHELTVNIRTVVDIVFGLLGGDTMTEGFGYRPTELCTVMTDGSVEVHDVLRIAGDGSTLSTFNLFDNAIEDIRNERSWKAIREASLDLCEKCRRCKFVHVCGGGYLPHRYSEQNGYRNPSVYCDDLYAIYEYVSSVLAKQIYVSKSTGVRLELGEAIARTVPDETIAQ